MSAAVPGPSTMVSDRDLPPLFQSSDQWAIARQSESFRVVRTQLFVLLAATTAAMLAERLDSRVPAVVAAVLYAASPAAASTTGCSLLVDGGWTAQ